MKFEKSNHLTAQADTLIPEQTMTMAKKASTFPINYPKYLKSALGCKVTDIDGNSFIDYTMGLGVFTLGYNYPCVVKAVIKQMEQGTIFSLPNEIEVQLAKKITEVIPSAEKVRFFKNGADVTGIAVRLSRSYTKKKHIIQCGYHGHHDWYSYVLRGSGTLDEVKKYTHSVPYNDINSIEKVIGQTNNNIACIMVETAFEKPENNYLEKLKALCDDNGTILIFDEMWTGFRFSLGGAQEYFNVTPHLSTFSKGISNGYPISVIVGENDIMNEFNNIWGFTTFGGDAVPMSAALATIREMNQKPVIKHIWSYGYNLKLELRKIISKLDKNHIFDIIGFDCRFMFKPNKYFEKIKPTIQEELVKDGILCNNMFVPSFSHDEEDFNKTVNSFTRILKIL
ncbi:MAG: aminotransferase class III-fold pyridoxal phosphate-dependent enzyme [Gammaproteobacteria bacterium]